MNIKYHIISFVFISLLVISCGKKEDSEKAVDPKTEQKEENHKENSPTIAELTEEQKKTYRINTSLFMYWVVT